MSSEKNSYRQIFKATSVFGGVQVFQIIANLLKSKIIALLLGPEGVGIFSLLLNPVNLVSQVTGLGINSSAIRDVAKSADDELELRKTVKTVRSWARITGLIGVLFLLLFAPWISRWTFGSEDYARDFQLLSVVVLFVALGNENDVILKGKRRIHYIAKAGVFSAFLGLIASVPIYYFFGKDGIVAVIMITYLSIYLFNKYFASKENIHNIELSRDEIFNRGKGMAALGSMMMLGTIVQTLTMYFTNMFIRSNGDLSDVGLFQAGMSITAVSIDMVYNAMAGDFYPRLSAICDDKKQAEKLINQQAEMAALLTTPIIIGMLIFAPSLIRLFLSSEFLSIQTFISWIFIAVAFRPVSYTIYYLLLAKGNTKSCFIFSVVVNSILIILYPLGYTLWGIEGLGVGYLLMMIIYAVSIVLYVYKHYGIRYDTSFCRLQSVNLLFGIFVFIVLLNIDSFWRYIINIPIFILITIFCIQKLNERMDLIQIVKNKVLKGKHNK